jgi:membrane associated rhomboid family serine protease
MFIPIQDTNPLRAIRFQWVTVTLIALNVVCYLFQLTTPGELSAASFAIVPAELVKMGILGGSAQGINDIVAVPEGLTLITYMFLHGGLLHLGSNMLFLWVFGDNVEDALGHGRYLAFYLLCGVAGGLLHTWAIPNSNLPLIGASGAVAGILAAYIMLHPRVRVWVLVMRVIPVNVTAAIAIGIWILTQFVMVAIADRTETAWWAHIGGILAGAALVLVMRRPGVPLFN